MIIEDKLTGNVAGVVANDDTKQFQCGNVNTVLNVLLLKLNVEQLEDTLNEV